MRDERRGFDPHGGNFTQGYGKRDLDRGPWEPVKFWRTPFPYIAIGVLLGFGALLLLTGCGDESPTSPPEPQVFCLTVTTADGTTSVTADDYLVATGRERHIKAWLRGQVVGWWNDVLDYDATPGACS